MRDKYVSITYFLFVKYCVLEMNKTTRSPKLEKYGLYGVICL